MSSAQGAIWGVHNLQIWLAHGFTALRDAGEADAGYGQLACEIALKRIDSRAANRFGGEFSYRYWRTRRQRLAGVR